jgi:hypothetical protein
MTGATLTIQPGVTVDFGSYYMLVNGTLIADGTSNNKITLTAANPASGTYSQQIQFNPSNTNSIIQNADADQVSILAKGCSLTISDNLFENPQRLAIQCTNGATATISGNVFQNVFDEGISVGGSSTVTGNLFNITTGWATAIVAHENAYVSGNQILGFYRGVMSDGSGTIEGNVIENCIECGIVSQGSATIQQNYISNSQVGISFGSGNVHDNTLVNNQVGVMLWSSASGFIDNSIVGSTRYSANITISSNANVPNNWWGTTDINAINQTIWDFKDDFTLGVVNFTPVLNAPSSGAPTSPTINITAPASTTSSQHSQTNPTNSTATSTATPSSSTRPVTTQNAVQNPILSQLGSSNLIQLATLIALVVVALLLAALIILTIRKRTSPKTVTKPRTKKKPAGRASPPKMKTPPTQ